MLRPGDIQRTMRLLASSTSRRRNHVRVLFYGQSITQSDWARKVAEGLRQRFPLAELELQNRALGGFASELLVKSAETDLYPYYPDLVIFHVYGAHTRYEDIVRRLRERTTAEILLQTDHVLKAEELSEETAADQLAPRPEQWSAFMNHAFLPGLSERYRAAVCDLRSAWKQHLRVHALAPAALLRDGLHLNTRGGELMADYLEQCLQPAPSLGPSVAEDWVQTSELEADTLRAGVLTFAFEGNRVDVLLSPGESESAAVRIDGRRPSEWPELYAFARAHSPEAGMWPPVFELNASAPLLLETFTLEVTRVRGAGDTAQYHFTLEGSKTGPDGSGSSAVRFESHSRRVVIDPEDWHAAYAFEAAGLPQPEHFSIELRVEPHFVDAFAGRAFDPASEHAITLAQGLPNTKHTLELRGDLSKVRAIRVYRPPLARF
ncbi:MAG: hypothetical protein JWN48_1243 [Myxococcaceae bacterium]|nr:hypothetical protein [Myxococcaceae bacterium]